MSRLRKWWRPAALFVAIVIVAQVGVSLLVRTHRVHAYLVRHLERAFGRPVEASHFSVLILPSPSLDAEQITVGEDPAFGNEYFLRAERLSASLRWTGFLRGRFEFGTLSLSRPSLNLVRNGEGRWNLERWLPPAKITVPGGLPAVYNVARVLGTPANHLTRIDIDDGRVNFKINDEKLPFAFTSVAGVVEQVAPGRWQVQLEAAPWRSGAALQTAGIVSVRGDVAGTSTRLQPAEIHLHWSDGALADLLRLFRGRDYGIRGEFALDATAKSGTGPAASTSPSGSGSGPYGDWSFELQARATAIHRWDLTERSDNPAMNVSLDGLLNVATGKAIAHRIVVETAKSNLRGTASAMISVNPSWEIRLDSVGVQAADLLNWYRAFQPGVDETVTVKQYFTGAMTLGGWSLQLKDAAFSSEGGEAKIPGIASPIRIGAIAGGRHRDTLTIEPFRVAYASSAAHADATAATSAGAAGKKRAAGEARGVVNVGFTHDFSVRAGRLSVDGHLDRVEDALRVAQAFGRTLNHGWELTGAATASLHLDWNGTLPRHWNGRVDVSNSELQAAGLNRPLNLTKTSLTWKDGLRTASITDVDGFGANWSGSIVEDPVTEFDGSAKWGFQLHADHLDATELDRWIGPRARPGWLQRLLPSLLGGAPAPQAPNEHASELVRRINAEGELRVDEFTMEKLRFQQVRADAALDDLHLDVREADAQWAGGKVRARVAAKFLPRPSYEVTADLDQVSLAQVPAPPRATERFAGTASGTVHFTTQGVGRDELLARLTGRGDVRMRNVEFRGWDVNASVAEGEPRAGESRWAAGEGTFTLRDRGIVLAGLRLESGREATIVKGTVSFGREADLTIQTTNDGRREMRTTEPGFGHILKISGPLDIPRVSVENTAAHQPAD
jgi:hypothetical protein